MSDSSSRPTPDRPPEKRGGRRYTDRRFNGPRRVRSGMKLRSREGPIVQSQLAQRWLALLERSIDEGRLRAGLEYARAGQIVSCSIEPGRIEASVQGRAPKPYSLTLRVAPLDREQWKRVIDAMAGEAVYVAHLLAGDLPAGTQQLLESLGLSLLPVPPDALRCNCACGQGAGLCKHAAAVGYLIAERIDDDPLISLTLRGMSGQQVLERLRQARAIRTHGVAAAHADPMIPESLAAPPPLEQCVDGFWRPGPRLAELKENPPPPHVRHALLRRLGPSPMQGKFPLVGLLASIYDSVAERAITLRDQAEQLE